MTFYISWQSLVRATDTKLESEEGGEEQGGEKEQGKGGGRG